MLRRLFSSIRNRLLLTFIMLVALTTGGTYLFAERQLAADLVSALDTRLTNQGDAVATELTAANHPKQLTNKLGAATGAHITVIGADGLIQADSVEPDTVGRPIGDAIEVAFVRKFRKKGSAIRQLHPDTPLEYLVAVPAALERVVRLSVPVDDIQDTRRRMRNRLLVAAAGGLVVALILVYLLLRAITRPLNSMSEAAERLAAGDYDAKLPEIRGELGVLSTGMMKMASEIKARIGELTEQRDLLSTVFGELVEGVIVVDASGAIVLANAAAKPLVGNALPDALVRLVASSRSGDIDEIELELVGRAVRASARPIRDVVAGGAGGRTKRGVDDSEDAIVVLYDVTRIRALEAVRREFLSNVAHELRTPVTSISGYAETLIGAGANVDAETAKEFLQTIHRNAQRISGLVSDLLVLDTLEARDKAVGERIVIGLADVAKHAANTTRGAIPTADVDIAIEPGLTVLGTREGLDHVIQNLVDNAVKYAKTKVTVSAAPMEDNAKRVRLVVTDRGPGIPVGQEERVFERFYRLDAGRSSDRGGSGLGLAIVKSQVEAMGGTIRVEQNEPGARFVVELDAAPVG